MNKKIVISFFIFFLLFGLFPFNNFVQAYIIDVTTSFEDGTISLPYSNSWLTTSAYTSSGYGSILFCVDNSFPKTGTKDFIVKASEYNKGITKKLGYFNYTYSNSQFMHFWEINIKCVETTGYSIHTFFSFRNSTGNEILQLYVLWHSPNTVLYYRNYLGSYVTVNTTAVVYPKIGFSFTADDTLNYFIDSKVISGSASNISNNCAITSLFIFQYSSQPNWHPELYDYLYLDDNRIVTSDTISGGGIVQGVFPECPGSEIGQLVSTSNYISLPPWYQYVTMIYKVVSTFNISEYRVLLENNYALSWYQTIELKINSYDLGYPTQTHSYGNTILLTWGNLSGVQIYGEMVYMCFKFPRHLTHPYNPDPQIPYFFQTIPTFDKTNNDIDGDGFIRLNVHADNNYWNNFCNNHYYRDYGMNIYDGYSPITEYFDLDYSFCYEYPQNILIHNYTNSLWVLPISVDIPNKVTIGYTLSPQGFLYSNYIKINKSGIEYYNETIGPVSQGGSFDYRVLSIGTYNISLYQNDINIKNVQFVATGLLNNLYSWIYTDKATVQPGENFNIYYNYPYANFPGIVLYGKCGETQKEVTNINKNSTGSIAYSVTDEGLYTLTLNTDTGGSYYQLNSTTILITGIHTNNIELSDSIIVAPKTITVFGETNYVGSDVYITKNGLFFNSVACQTRFSFYNLMEDSGVFIYSLVVKHGNTIITLDSATITVSKTATAEETTDWFMSFINGLPFFVKIIIAIIIVLMITLLPLIVTVVLSQTAHFDSVSIPSLVYIGFFMFGVIIDCLIGLLSWAILFIVLLAMIIAFAVLYISNKKEA